MQQDNVKYGAWNHGNMSPDIADSTKCALKQVWALIFIRKFECVLHGFACNHNALCLTLADTYSVQLSRPHFSLHIHNGC